jgi:DNA-binding transcriptional ArsR family regulator
MVENQSSRDRVFHALSDPTRRAMIERLSQRELTVGQLAEPLAMSLAGASKHVGVLEKAGIVARRKRGRERVCTLQPGGLLAARDWVERYSRFWTERLDALEKALEEDGDE